MAWQVSDARLESIEAAAIIAVVCEYCEQRSITRLPPIGARDLAISETGDVLLYRPRRSELEPALDVVLRLADELIALVDTPADALAGMRGWAGDFAIVTDVAGLGDWLCFVFELTHSRAVLRPVADRMKAYADWAPLSVQGDAAPEMAAPPWSETTGPPARRDLRIADGMNPYADWTPPYPAEHAAPEMGARPRRETTRQPARKGGLIAAGVAVLGLGLVTTLVERGNRGSSDRQTVPDSPSPPATRELRSGPASSTIESPAPPAPLDPVEPPPASASTDSLQQAADSLAAADVSRPPTYQSVPLETPGIDSAVFSPSFDSNGSAMFFHVGRAPQAQLVEARLDQADQLVQVTALTQDGSKNYHARLSPEGTHVAFDSDREGERAVFIAQRDGSRLRRVSGPGFAAIPTWSPDGSKLAFVRGETARPQVWNLWVLDIASNQLQRFTSYRYGQLWGASWFPDGNRVCYSHERSIHVLDLRTGRQERFESPVAGRIPRTPAVSPEGGRIVFQVQGDGVWLLELDDRTMRRILDDTSAEEFTWDPQGRRVAYHSRRDGQWRIWITAAPPSAVQ